MEESNPDELLKMVEAEMAMKRAARGASSSRNAFRVWSLVIIFALVVGSLFFLEFLVSQIQRPQHHPDPATQVAPPR